MKSNDKGAPSGRSDLELGDKQSELFKLEHLS